MARPRKPKTEEQPAPVERCESTLNIPQIDDMEATQELELPKDESVVYDVPVTQPQPTHPTDRAGSKSQHWHEQDRGGAQ